MADLGSKTDKKKWFVIEAENSMLKLFHFFPSFIALFTSTFYLPIKVDISSVEVPSKLV